MSTYRLDCPIRDCGAPVDVHTEDGAPARCPRGHRLSAEVQDRLTDEARDIEYQDAHERRNSRRGE